MRPIRLVLFVLLFPLITPVGEAQAKTDTELMVTDPAGDVSIGPASPQPGFPPSVPSNPAIDYVDLTSLRVYDESLDGIRIAVGLQSLNKAEGSFSSHSIEVFFGAQSTPPVSYTLRWYDIYSIITDPTTQNRTFDHYATFCFHNAPDQRSSCLPQRAVGWIDHDNKELVAFVPKASLQGLDPVREGYEAPVTVSMPMGTRLGNFTVESQGDFWTDRLPDAGEAGPYVLQKPTANDRLRVRLYTNETAEGGNGPTYPGGPYYPYLEQPTDFPVVSVEPGAPFPVQIEIRNLNGAKRLVNLTIEHANQADSAKWPVRIAPSLQIPGNETRVINLVVNATSQVNHRDATTVRIIARAVGFDDEVGAQTLRLVASVPPSLTANKLFFHATEAAAGSFDELGLCSLPFMCGPSGGTYLNTIEDDTMATHDDVIARGQVGYVQGGGQGLAGGTVSNLFSLEQPLPRDVVLDVNKEAAGEIKVGASQSFDGTLTVTVRAGDIHMGGATIPFTASDMGNPIPFTFLPLIDSERLPRDSVISIETAITYSYAGPGAVFIVQAPGIVPKGSFLELPIIPDPRAEDLSIASEDALISLNVKGDRDDFVNPGESRAFNLTLINEGTDTDNVNITGYIESGKCGIQIKPGQRFRLDAGDSAKLGVLLHAHNDAKEGERCKARVQAVSESNPNAYASVLIEAIVTSGIDLADDSDNYTADAESVEKLQREESSRTPGLGFAASLVAALGVFTYRRRRLGGA